jgi:hypothetical protein
VVQDLVTTVSASGFQTIKRTPQVLFMMPVKSLENVLARRPLQPVACMGWSTPMMKRPSSYDKYCAARTGIE